MAKQETNKFKGLTRKQYKRVHGSETPGKDKGENCKASAYEKALTKYPRAYKTMSTDYHNLMKAQQKRGKNFPQNSLFNNF